MPATAYTTRFVLGFGADTWRYYTTPAGHRAVITSVVVTNSGSTAGYVSVLVAEVVLWRTDQASVASQATSMRAVCYAGERIAVYTSYANMRCQVTGYLFDDSSSGLLELQDAQEGLAAPGDQPLGELVLL